MLLCCKATSSCAAVKPHPPWHVEGASTEKSKDNLYPGEGRLSFTTRFLKPLSAPLPLLLSQIFKYPLSAQPQRTLDSE